MTRRLSIIALLLGVLSACASADPRFASPGDPRPSPSGRFTATVALGPQQQGVDTWVPVITDAGTGREAFRDPAAYSARHGVGVTWASGSDELWVLSGDVGTARISRGADGHWVKTVFTPETLHRIPAEIRELSG